MQYLNNYLFVGLFLFLTVHYINSSKRLINASKILACSYFIQLFIVFMQYAGFKAFYLSETDNLGLNTGMKEASTGTVRYWGSFGEALDLSTYLTTVGIGVMVYLISIHKNKWITATTLCLTLFGIYLTGSRAGMSIFIAVFFIYLIREKIFSRTSFVIFTSICITLIYNIYDLFLKSDANISRFSQLREGDFRYVLWTKGFQIVFDSPIYGSSIGCLNYVLEKYGILADFATTSSASGHVENTYLTILFSTGFIGIILFFNLVRYPIRLMNKYKFIKFSKNTTNHQITKVYAYSYFSLLLCMLSEPSVGVHMRNTLLFVLISAFIYSSIILSLKNRLNHDEIDTPKKEQLIYT
ncbi:O-antigen ligase family protein [Spirosoma sordidisoli]|nr:O-antigen ligase family protein [Spirosoma sordidisoli]